jgi:hypothetical protein
MKAGMMGWAGPQRARGEGGAQRERRMIGVTTLPAPLDVVVFHDESGDFGHGEWAFIGLLWVPHAELGALAAEMAALRGGHGGEIHFYRFPRNFGGAYGVTARIAQAWFERWLADWSRRTWFSALAVNRRHLKYDHARFGRPEQAYNHFSALALTSGLKALFKAHDAVTLTVYSDERWGRVHTLAEGVAGRAAFVAALRDALAGAGTADEERAGPRITPPDVPVHCLSSHADEGPFSAEQELLQLTDLLLGAVSTAIAPQSRAATKLWFAREIARVMADVRLAPGPKSFGLHGRFLVSYFPNYAGRLYNDGPIQVWDI